jgi:hypothetical protein
MAGVAETEWVNSLLNIMSILLKLQETLLLLHWAATSDWGIPEIARAATSDACLVKINTRFRGFYPGPPDLIGVMQRLAGI